MTKKTDPTNEPDGARPRKGKRVTWTPEGNPGDGSDTVPASESPEAWGETAPGDQSNDEQLKRDKPPHWG